jgi:hypothetical protein
LGPCRRAAAESPEDDSEPVEPLPDEDEHERQDDEERSSILPAWIVSVLNKTVRL